MHARGEDSGSRLGDPADFRLVILILRALRGWGQSELAEAAGVSASSVYRYEAGDSVPAESMFGRIVAAVGVPRAHVERLFAWIRTARGAAGRAPEDGTGFLDAVCAEFSESLSEVIRSAATLVLGDPAGLGADPWAKASPPSPEDRQPAAILWSTMKRRSPSERRLLVEDAQEYRSWALCELLCAESVKAAADSADRAGDLAELALLIADLAPGEESWRLRLQGYAWAHLGNARRVQGDLPEADQAFARSGKLWQAGKPGEDKLLSEAQVVSLEVSLRIYQSRLSEAAILLDRALAVDEGILRMNLLIQRARLLEWSGAYEGALETLRQVLPLTAERNDLRLTWIMKLNLSWILCHLGRFAEAEALLPEVRALTAQLDNELDTLRVRWLEGRIATGLGHTEEALEALSEVRREFAARGIVYDAALATLELAVLHLEQGRTREVKRLAQEMAPIFRAQGVHQPALAALKLFRRAAEQEAATVELARRVVEYLYRAQHNPLLHFEAHG